MIKILPAFIVLVAVGCCSNRASAQFEFANPVINLCADGITEISSYENWTAYQTIDGTMNGELDTQHCINLGSLGSDAAILEEEIDISKPVFLHWHGSPVLLQPNYLYNIWPSMYNEGAINTTDITYCDDGFCQGYGIAVQVPDDPDDADSEPQIRWHFQEFGTSQWSGGFAPACLASEYFESDQHIVDLYLKFQFNPGFSQFYVYANYLDYVWDMQTIDNSSIQWYYNGANNYSLDWGNYLALHELSFPNLANITYLELTPQPNTATQEEVILTIGYETTLTFQPYTDLRGALIEGSADLRHNVTLINNGGEFCMPMFFELVFGPGENFVFNDGHVGLAWGSCLRFQPQSTLHLGYHAMLHYGEQGMGMLGLQSGCALQMDELAELHIDNTVRMFNEPWQTDLEDVHIYLREGNQLVFGPYSHLENFSTNEEMKLVVHLEGGYLNIDELSDEEKKHIEVEYAKKNETLALLQLQGNPATDVLSCSLHALAEGNAQCLITDANGKLIQSGSVLLQSGYNHVTTDISALSEGIYFARFTLHDANVVIQFVKQ
ncbi:MAG: T9SS type A sorting domain-containing protein [Flavobacteriales bacterium]